MSPIDLPMRGARLGRRPHPNEPPKGLPDRPPNDMLISVCIELDLRTQRERKKPSAPYTLCILRHCLHLGLHGLLLLLNLHGIHLFLLLILFCSLGLILLSRPS
jgi:hypothetical protein